MSNLIVATRRVHQRQPSRFARINWANPLTRGLVRADNFALLGRDTLGGPAWETAQFAVADVGMALAQNGSGGKAVTSPGLHTKIISGLTVLSIVRRTGAPSISEFFYQHGSGSSNYNWGLYDSGGGARWFFIKNTSGTAVNPNFTYSGGGLAVVVGAYSSAGGYAKIYQNGALQAQSAQTGNIQQNDYALGSFNYQGGSGIYRQPLALVWNRELSAAEIRAISANPWQVFSRRRNRTLVSLGAPAGATLEGHAQAQASASGNLTLSATLDGLALAVASASGNLTTQIPLAGAAVSVVSAAGNLLTGIPLSAAAVAQASAAGNLTAQIRLNGAALAQAAASAGLTSAILLAGNAQGQAAASGTLAGGTSGLAGDAQAQASAVATLTTSIRLSGSAAAQAGVSGLLTTAIPLTAAALASAIATGTLSVPILLAGEVKARVSASGTLAGTTVRPIPDDRFFAVITAREWSAVAEPRDYSVSAVDRTWEARL